METKNFLPKNLTDYKLKEQRYTIIIIKIINFSIVVINISIFAYIIQNVCYFIQHKLLLINIKQ